MSRGSMAAPAFSLPAADAWRVFISDELRKILNQYLAQIGQLDDGRAFIRSSRTMGHFSNKSLSVRFNAMGDANIAATAGYCWVSDEQLANAVNVI
jgi:integrase/recombinase XerD